MEHAAGSHSVGSHSAFALIAERERHENQRDVEHAPA
jgi:hypothetical protein